ncbi:hypothetical protein DBR32_14940 [Taibaiella sp. KBW10]|uniref:DUF7674 family protein n=1 Tax=Taibaiella sp. KBW10 TaxID=2153357 RepID=UPI000F59F999|nr:hypothetical protein [Taibaiella sp. KBW10]RQO29871.1 hypothetical protein DBR32_14940 [Taibaiella sp. KBW10]
MNQYEVADEIATALPEVKAEVSKIIYLKNPFALIRVVTRHTQKMVEQHNELRIDQCLKLIDRIYAKGDLLVRNAIENIFIFSLDHIVASCNSRDKDRLLAKIPLKLHTAYVNQVYRSGI